ncbi:hypothetical protein ACWGUL_01380 [Streptomyces albidoflavus]
MSEPERRDAEAAGARTWHLTPRTIAPNDTALLRQQLAGALTERDLYRQWLTHRTQQLADAHDLIHQLTHPETSE